MRKRTSTGTIFASQRDIRTCSFWLLISCNTFKCCSHCSAERDKNWSKITLGKPLMTAKTCSAIFLRASLVAASAISAMKQLLENGVAESFLHGANDKLPKKRAQTASNETTKRGREKSGAPTRGNGLPQLGATPHARSRLSVPQLLS